MPGRSKQRPYENEFTDRYFVKLARIVLILDMISK